MDVKLIAADGCWRIESVHEEIGMRGLDIDTLLSPMIKEAMMTGDDPGYRTTMRRRRYSYYGRDSHGMPIYKESV